MYVTMNMGLKGKSVKNRCGPATVKGSFLLLCHCCKSGKTIKCDELKPGDLLTLKKGYFLRCIKKGFIFIPKIHFKKRIFFTSGRDVRKENLNFYTNTTER